MRLMNWSIALGLLMVDVCFGQDATTLAIADPPATGAATAASASPWAITGGIDFQTKYIFRGFATTTEGVIAQPYVQIAYTIADVKPFLGDELTVAPYVGTWNNITSHPRQIKPGAQSGDWRYWSEIDADAGLTMTYNNFTLGLGYVYYSYPNGSIATDMEAGFNLGYDDSGIWADTKAFAAINPHIAYYHEFQNLGGPDGGYLELGIAPTLKPFNIGPVPVTISSPIIIGMATDAYYANANGSTNALGYFEFGANVSIPLTFISDQIGGAWNLVGEVDYYLLNANNARGADGGKANDITGRVGLTFRY